MCAELEQLRQRAARILKELHQRRQVVRAYLATLPPGEIVTQSDYEGFLLRRLQHTTSNIEQHIAVHNCQD